MKYGSNSIAGDWEVQFRESISWMTYLSVFPAFHTMSTLRRLFTKNSSVEFLTLMCYNVESCDYLCHNRIVSTIQRQDALRVERDCALLKTALLKVYEYFGMLNQCGRAQNVLRRTSQTTVECKLCTAAFC